MMATWPAVPVGDPGSEGTAVLNPEVGDLRSPGYRWVALGAGARLDVRPGQELMTRDEANVAIHEVIDAWRAVERELARLGANDWRGHLLEAEIRGLRDLHQRLFAARSRPSSMGLGDRGISWSDFGEWLSPSARQLSR